MWGTGKSILGPVLGTYKKVERQNLCHFFEYISTLTYFGKIEKLFSNKYLKILADNLAYDTFLSRQINLKLGDDSGLINNPKKLKSIRRLFKKDDKIHNIKEININCPIIQIMSHNLFPCSEILFQTFFENFSIMLVYQTFWNYCLVEPFFPNRIR